jgi:A/G-specific adenine glycosylase
MAESLAQGPHPGDWTQALMELGATICLPREPLCVRCPASRFGVARRGGRPERFPEAQPALAPREERRVVLVATSGRRVLLVPDDADQRATWTLPYARLGASTGSRAARGLLSRLVGSAGPDPDRAGSFRHRTFSHSLTYEIWSVDLRARPSPGRPGCPKSLWATSNELARLPVRSHTLKALRSLDR